MIHDFPISVKLRGEENYTMFLSNGDSINLAITDSYIQRLYRNYSGMQEYEVFVEALCQIHEIISNKEFDKIFEEYCEKESEFLSRERPKKRLTVQEEITNAIDPRKKKGEQTLKLDFEE